MTFSFRLALLLLIFAVPGVSQDAFAQITQTTASHCTEELFQQAEQSFERRKLGSENLALAEKQLSNVARVCKEQPAGFHAEEQLRVVHEELANHNLLIALFYLSKSYCGRGGQAGARSRLKNIVERYPAYSKFDQVLFLLGEINMNDRNFDEAASYYQRLIGAYPASEYIGKASLQLSAIGILKNEKSAQSIP